MPTEEDADRLHIVARQYRARNILLATWTKGKAASFFRLRRSRSERLGDWIEIDVLNAIFR
jgi:hypothetical protein